MQGKRKAGGGARKKAMGRDHRPRRAKGEREEDSSAEKERGRRQ